jgi:Arc/MetJ family transcription regulator
MVANAKARKIRRSFTLTAESIAIIEETRNKHGLRKNSDAVELLLREAMLESKRRDLEAAYKKYYDTATDEELANQSEWAEMVGPNVLSVTQMD